MTWAVPKAASARRSRLFNSVAKQLLIDEGHLTTLVSYGLCCAFAVYYNACWFVCLNGKNRLDLVLGHHADAAMTIDEPPMISKPLPWRLLKIRTICF